MLQVVPGMAITFGVYHQLRDVMGDWWAASIAAILSKTLVMPLDVLRKRHQIRLNTLKLVLDRDGRVEQGAFLWRQLQELWRREGSEGMLCWMDDGSDEGSTGGCNHVHCVWIL